LGAMPPATYKPPREGDFLNALLHKRRMRRLMEDIPLYLVLDELCPLKRAAAFAAEGVYRLLDK